MDIRVRRRRPVRRSGAVADERPDSTQALASAPESGRAIFSDEAWRHLADELQLSGRESQIVRGVFDDQTEPAIAAHLGISSHTVHTHLDRLYRKLGVSSRVALVLRVVAEYLSNRSS